MLHKILKQFILLHHDETVLSKNASSKFKVGCAAFAQNRYLQKIEVWSSLLVLLFVFKKSSGSFVKDFARNQAHGEG